MDTQIKDALNELKTNFTDKLRQHDAAITELAQKAEGLTAMSGSVKSLGFAAEASKSVGDNLEQLDKHGSLRLEVKAATDIITTAQVGNTQNVGLTGPTPMPMGIQMAIPARIAIGASSIEYSRYQGHEGDAAVQAAEGDAKAAVRGDWLLVNQPSITIAGHSLVSRQSIHDSVQLQGAINAVMQRSVSNAVDSMLWNGSGALFDGLETLADLHHSTVFDALPDAISEGIAAVQANGFNPTAVVVNPTTWVDVVTAKADGSGEYLSGNYLGATEQSLRGLPVVLSLSVPAGRAVLIDANAVELVITQNPILEVGYVNDGFIRNQATLLLETRVAPVLKANAAVTYVVPAGLSI